jgi:hypothetical protein
MTTPVFTSPEYEVILESVGGVVSIVISTTVPLDSSHSLSVLVMVNWYVPSMSELGRLILYEPLISIDPVARNTPVDEYIETIVFGSPLPEIEGSVLDIMYGLAISVETELIVGASGAVHINANDAVAMLLVEPERSCTW